MKQNSMNQYGDILHLPHPVSQRRSRMTNYDRAAQFSPFAALTGYDAVIAETARLTDVRVELDEMEQERLNEKLREVLEIMDAQPKIAVTYFQYDERKAGGTYIRATGHVKKIDSYTNSILLTDGRSVPIWELIGLELLDECVSPGSICPRRYG